MFVGLRVGISWNITWEGFEVRKSIGRYRFGQDRRENLRVKKKFHAKLENCSSLKIDGKISQEKECACGGELRRSCVRYEGIRPAISTKHGLAGVESCWCSTVESFVSVYWLKIEVIRSAPLVAIFQHYKSSSRCSWEEIRCWYFSVE